MSRLWLLLALTSFSALANPTGSRWFLDACNGQSCPAGMSCKDNRCLPVFRTAATIGNLPNVNDVNGVPYATIVAATQRAFSNWTSTRVSGCSTSWDVIYGGSFQAPQGTAALGNNGTNNVIWLTGSDYVHGSTTLALTTTWVLQSGQIVDADMELNGNVKWDDNFAGGANRDRYDYESIILHEAGHFLGLAHSAPRAAVMYADFVTAETRRSLTATDTADVCSVYPPGTGGQGASCTNTANCTQGRVCEAPVGTTQRICTKDCTAAGQTCPTGTSCQPSTDAFACLPTSQTADLCRFCGDGRDCESGICLFDDTTGMRWCSSACKANTQCGAGFTCASAPFGNFCAPNGQCTMQCGTGTDQCPVGFECKSGTCLPSGKVGDRCEISGTCKACGTCVQDVNDPSVAFCRGCCSGAQGNAQCTGCATTTCPANDTCVPLNGNTDKACLPTLGAGVCQPCSAQSPCNSGLECYQGTCHASCNAQMPGACAACFDRGPGKTGLCACGQEVGRDGDPCGLNADMSFVACITGLECVGTGQKNCRKLCNKDDPNSCPQGENCSPVGTKFVCVNTTDGSVCGQCTASGTCQNGATCNQNRCYAQCNVNTSGGCRTCVQLEADGRGVCACDDQISGVNQACGTTPIRSCQMGTTCFGMAPNEPTCRAACDLATGKPCSQSEQCRSYAGGSYCLDRTDFPVSDSGTGGGTGRADSGTGGGGTSTVNQGCGCTQSTAAWQALVLLGALIWRRKPRA
jgi:Matrixin